MGKLPRLLASEGAAGAFEYGLVIALSALVIIAALVGTLQ